MSTIRKSITFTEALHDYIQAVVSTGSYTNESEYLRDLVRKDRERNMDWVDLRNKVQEGLKSPLVDDTVQDIFNEALKSVEDRRKAS